MDKILKNIGLTQNEINVYKAALSANEVNVSDLAKISGVKRTSVYSCIDKLQDFGLLTQIKKGKKKFFIAEEPDKLLDYVKLKKEEWERNIKRIDNIIPELKAISKNNSSVADIKVGEGINNIWRLKEEYFEELKETREAFAIGYEGEIRKIVGDSKFEKDITQRRRQIKGSKMYLIVDPHPIHIKNAHMGEKDFREYRFLPKHSNLNSVVLICGEIVGIIKITKPYQGILIRSEEVSNIMKFMWQAIWDALPDPLNK